MAINIQNIPTEVTPTFKMDELNNKKLFVTTLYKYTDFKQSIALEKINKIDLIKNNYNVGTIKNYLNSIRIYLNSNKKMVFCPEYVYKIVDELVAKKYPKLRPSSEDSYKPHNKKVVPKSIFGVIPSASEVFKPLPKKEERQPKIVDVDLEDEIKKLVDKKDKMLSELHTIEKQIEAFSITLEFLKTREDNA